MFTKKEIQEIIELVSQSPIQKFKYTDGTAELVLIKENPKQKTNKSKLGADEQSSLQNTDTSASDGDTKEDTNKSGLLEIAAPTIGAFYLSSEQGGSPFVQVGDTVAADTVVCVLETMKLFTEIAAKVRGTIVEILAEDGQFVEYGQPLFLVKPE